MFGRLAAPKNVIDDSSMISAPKAPRTMTDQISAIARQHLRIRTLEQRNADRLDFHDLAVWQIREALEAAYAAGLSNALVADMRSARFSVPDSAQENQEPLAVEVRLANGFLEIAPQGYGDFGSTVGCPVVLERMNGRLVLRVFGDINQEDATEQIDLEGAREINRKE